MPRKKMDVRGEEVEKFRLTKEQMAFQKRFEGLAKLRALLEARTLAAQAEMSDVRELWQLLEGGYSQLQPPSKMTRELPGMEFGDEEGSPTQPPWALKY